MFAKPSQQICLLIQFAHFDPQQSTSNPPGPVLDQANGTEGASAQETDGFQVRQGDLGRSLVGFHGKTQRKMDNWGYHDDLETSIWPIEIWGASVEPCYRKDLFKQMEYET